MNSTTKNAHECTGDLLDTADLILQHLVEKDPNALAELESLMKQPLAEVTKETADLRKSVNKQWRAILASRSPQTELGDPTAEIEDMKSMLVLQQFMADPDAHATPSDVIDCASHIIRGKKGGSVVLVRFLFILIYRVFCVELVSGVMRRRFAADKFKGGGWRETDLGDDEWTKSISEGLSASDLSTVNWALKILVEAGIISQRKVPEPVTGRKMLYVRLHSDRLLLLLKLARELSEAQAKAVGPALRSLLGRDN